MCERGVLAVTLTWGFPLRHSDFKAVELSLSPRNLRRTRQPEAVKQRDGGHDAWVQFDAPRYTDCNGWDRSPAHNHVRVLYV